MNETETGFSSLGLGRDGHVIVLAGRVDGTFVITGEAIDLRALAERIFVGSGETPTVEFSRALLSRHIDDAFGFAVNVVDLGKGSTAENGSGNAERNGITLHAFLGLNRAFTVRDPGIGTNETAELVFVLTVLGKAEDLRDAEVVGSTPGHAEGIFGVGIGTLVHDRVNNEARAEGTYSVGPFAVPYVQSFFPTTGLMATCMFDVGNCVMAGGGTFAVIAGTRVKTTLWRTVKLVVSKLVRSGPLVTFAFVGLMSVLDMRLPDGVITSTAIGAHANTFLCMIMIGESISFSMGGGKMGKVLKLLASRWVVCILIALGVWHFLPFEEEIRMALTLTCLSPIPAMSLVFTAQLDGDIAMAANMSSLSVGCSIIGMSVALMLFGAL